MARVFPNVSFAMCPLWPPCSTLAPVLSCWRVKCIAEGKDEIRFYHLPGTAVYSYTPILRVARAHTHVAAPWLPSAGDATDSFDIGLLVKLLGSQKWEISCPGHRRTTVQNLTALAVSSSTFIFQTVVHRNSKKAKTTHMLRYYKNHKDKITIQQCQQTTE